MWILRSSKKAQGRAFIFRLPEGASRVIGRAPGADFMMDAALVSRLHCRISASKPSQIEVHDLDSTNGTFVNGQRILKGVLGTGDRLRVGRVELVVSREA